MCYVDIWKKGTAGRTVIEKVFMRELVCIWGGRKNSVPEVERVRGDTKR